MTVLVLAAWAVAPRSLCWPRGRSRRDGARAGRMDGRAM